MKTLKAFCSAAILVFALSIRTTAGQIDTPGYTAPKPPITVVTEPPPEELNIPGVSTSPQTLGLIELLLDIIGIV